MGSSCSSVAAESGNVGGQRLTPQSRTALAGAAALEALHDKELQRSTTDPLRMLPSDRMLPHPSPTAAATNTATPQTLSITGLVTHRAVVPPRDNNPLDVSASRAAPATMFVPVVAVSGAGGTHYYPTHSATDRSGLLRPPSDASLPLVGFVSSSDMALSQAPDGAFLWRSSRSAGGGSGAVARVVSATSAPSLEGFLVDRSRSSRSGSCDESQDDAIHDHQHQQQSEASLKSHRRSTAANSTWGNSATAVEDDVLPSALALPMFAHGSK